MVSIKIYITFNAVTDLLFVFDTTSVYKLRGRNSRESSWVRLFAICLMVLDT